MKMLGRLALISTVIAVPVGILAWILPDPIGLADRPSPSSVAQTAIQEGSQCGGQITGGNGNTVIIDCDPTNFSVDSEKKTELSILCDEENFGIIPPVFFETKDTYNVGEIISARYSGTCPNKTKLVVVRASYPDRSVLNNHHIYGTVAPVRDYEGEIRFDSNRQERPDTFQIMAIFKDRQNKVFSGGRSLPFEVRERF